MQKFAIFITVLLSHVAYSQTKNVILCIGDGFGIAPKTATRMALGQGREGKKLSTDINFKILALDKLRYQATATTHSMNSWITDSAPGASAYACGKNGKIDNEVISFNPATNQSIETILEEAKKQGYAVGLVTTTRITHATPAAFGSHIWNRELEDFIAAQLISSTQNEYEEIFNSSISPNSVSGYDQTRDWILPQPKIGVEIDVLLGGGGKSFLPRNQNYSKHDTIKDKSGKAITDSLGNIQLLVKKDSKTGRIDNIDLVSIAKNREYTYINSRDALINIDFKHFEEKKNAKLLGIFNGSHLSYEQDRQVYKPWEPSLSDMITIAIEVLKRKSKKGFFLMVEGGRIDHLEHANAGAIVMIENKLVVKVDSTANPDGIIGNIPFVYGSDYIIKEVLAFDYAVEVARKFTLNPKNGKTLLVSTSDHECGGSAVVSLHDEADKHKHGTKMRTYADEIHKTGIFKNGANPTDGKILRGDIATNGWYPDYVMYDFQGKKYPKPASQTAKRIVISYASNPYTNGNGSECKQTESGNHTPQDVVIYADDTMNGKFASQISGKGLLDNTDIHPILKKFLKLKIK